MTAAEIHRVPSPVANLSGAPPGLKRKAPASAGTDARAHLSMAAGRQAHLTCNGGAAQ